MSHAVMSLIYLWDGLVIKLQHMAQESKTGPYKRLRSWSSSEHGGQKAEDLFWASFFHPAQLPLEMKEFYQIFNNSSFNISGLYLVNVI